MKKFFITKNRRLRSTPFASRIESQGLKGYTIYNHMFLPTAFNSLEEDYNSNYKNSVDKGLFDKLLTPKGKNNEIFVMDVLSTENQLEVPSQVMLYKAYPNPFNPVSNISFSLPSFMEFIIRTPSKR